jgi:hypothetical protein
MTRSLRILVVLVGLMMGLHMPRVAAQETLAFQIGKKATLVNGGQAVDVQATVTCPAGAAVLEAFLYVTQEGNQSQFASLQPVCDGAPHTFMVRAQAVGFVFHRGRAQVSGYLLLTTGEAISPTGVVRLRSVA